MKSGVGASGKNPEQLRLLFLGLCNSGDDMTHTKKRETEHGKVGRSATLDPVAPKFTEAKQ